MRPFAQVRAHGAERFPVPWHVLAALLAAAAVALGAGCGGDDEPDSPPVAKVGDTPITRAQLDAAMRPILKALASQDVKDAATAKRQYQRDALDGLIRAEWLRQEAEAHGVAVSDAELRAGLKQQQSGFPTVAAWERSLKQAGSTAADARRSMRAQLLHDKLVAAEAARQPKPSEADVRAYFVANRKRFGVPEIRLAYKVRAATEADARAAKRALAGGARWSAVVRRYSSEPASRMVGAYRMGTTPTEWDEPLDGAAFAAKPHTLVGPVRTDDGWHVFEIAEITPARPKRFDEVRADVRQNLEGERKQRAASGFEHVLEERYLRKTTCARTYDLEVCGGSFD